MQCPSCGAQVSENASTCAVCGQTLVDGAVVAAHSQLGQGQEARVGSGRVRPPEVGSDRCPACDIPLERDAVFCSGCGTTLQTGEFASPPLPDEDVALEEDVVVPREIAPEPEYEHAFEPAFEPAFERADDDAAVFNRTGPIPVVRTPASAEPWFTWVPAVAAGFAVFAVLMALLVHAFGPSSLPGYSPAEVSLKVQMRAVEWLLAGILAAGVGIIAKR
jgi:hypothetical protein